VRFLPVIALLSGCGFSIGVGSSNPPNDADNGDDSSTNMPDDGTPATMPIVRRIEIGPNKVTNGPHTDFPMLVTAAITAHHPMGFDIYFTLDQSGTQKLAHEIERYAPNALVAWVKVPSLSQATQIYLHYGDTTITTSQENKTAVWSNSFAAVWHLSDLGDATNVNNGTDNGSTMATGKIAGGRSFDDDSITVGSNAAIDDVFAGGGTAEAWIFADTWGESGLGRIYDKGPSNTVFSMGDGNTNSSLLFGRTFTNGAGNWTSQGNTLQIGTWMHVAVTYNSDSAANDPTFYINGMQRSASATSNAAGAPLNDSGGNGMLGDRTTGQRAYDGLLDEVRLSTATRSGGWITTSYENQRDPASFAVVSAPL
jgi:hypothetical protein